MRNIQGTTNAPITIASYPGERAYIGNVGVQQTVAIVGNSGPSVGYVAGISTESTGNLVIRDITINNATGVGIAIGGGTDILITNVTVHDSARNEFDGNPAGIKFTGVDRTRVEGSIFYDNFWDPVPTLNFMRGMGIQYYQTKQGYTNGVPRGYADCVMYKHAASTTTGWFHVYNNTFRGCGGFGAISMGTQNAHIKGNLIINSTGNSVHSQDIGGITYQVNQLWEYNTIVNSQGLSFATSLTPYNNLFSILPNNITFRNNIVYDNASTYTNERNLITIDTYGDDTAYVATAPELHFSNNCYYNPNTAIRFALFSANNGGTYGNLGGLYTFAQWQALTYNTNALNYDTNSVNANPLFVNAVANDFRLQSGSPCTAMGVYGTESVTPPPPTVNPVFFDLFDTGAKTAPQNGYQWGGTSAVTVVSDISYSGSNSLRFTFGPDAEAVSDDSNAEQRFVLGENLSEVWFEYQLYIPPNFYHRSIPGDTNNNKFFLVWGENYDVPFDSWLGGYEYQRSSTVGSNSVLRPYARSPVAGLNDITTGEVDNTKPLISSNGPIFPNSWNNIRLHFKMATGPDTYDGVMELWINGTLKFQETNGRFWYRENLSTGAPNPNYDDPACFIRNGYILGWANSGFTELTYLNVDNFAIYKVNPGWSQETTDTVIQNRLVNTTPSSTSHASYLQLGPGMNRKVVACTSLEHASAGFTGVNYNGVPMNLLRANRNGTAHLACYFIDVPDALTNDTYQLSYDTNVGVRTTLVAWQLRNAQIGIPEDLRTTSEAANQGGNLTLTLTNVTRGSWILTAETDSGDSVSYSISPPLVAAGGSISAGHNTRYADDRRESSGTATVNWIPTITTGNRIAIAMSFLNRYETPFQSLRRTGDLDGNGIVNIADVILIIQNFKRRGSYDTGADINNDGIVNIFDMVLLGKNWG